MPATIVFCAAIARRSFMVVSGHFAYWSRILRISAASFFVSRFCATRCMIRGAIDPSPKRSASAVNSLPTTSAWDTAAEKMCGAARRSRVTNPLRSSAGGTNAPRRTPIPPRRGRSPR